MIKLILYKWFGIDDRCESCETLRMQLAIANEEKKQLLDSILDMTKPKVETNIPINLTNSTQRAIPWRVRKEMLESESRKTAELLKRKVEEMKPIEKLDISDLEKEVMDGN